MEDAFATACRVEIGKDTLRKEITALNPDATAVVHVVAITHQPMVEVRTTMCRMDLQSNTADSAAFGSEERSNVLEGYRSKPILPYHECSRARSD
jgi:hypothetical protein